MPYVHIQTAIGRIIIHSYMIGQNIRMIGAGLLGHSFKQNAIFAHDPAVNAVCCLLENLGSRSRSSLLQTASVYLCAHLEYIVPNQRLHFVMPGLSKAFLTAIIVYVTFLKNST